MTSIRTRYNRRCDARLLSALAYCRAWPVKGKRRCKHHGGQSTGPVTAEGMQRSAEAGARNLASWQASRRKALLEAALAKLKVFLHEVVGDVEEFPPDLAWKDLTAQQRETFLPVQLTWEYKEILTSPNREEWGNDVIGWTSDAPWQLIGGAQDDKATRTQRRKAAKIVLDRRIAHPCDWIANLPKEYCDELMAVEECPY